MQSVIIGIQGGKGSFSEEATKVFVKKHGCDNYNISYHQHWGSFLLPMLGVDILPIYLLLLEWIFWKL